VVSAVSILPSITLRGGRVVVLKKGEETLLESQPEAARRDADEIAEHLSDKHGALLAIDLDGIERAEPNYTLLQDLGDVATLWVDAGIVTEEEATDLIIAGADHVVVSSRALEPKRLDAGLLREVAEMAENTVLGVHWEGGVRASGGRVGWREASELGKEARGLGVAKAILFDLDRARSSGTMNFTAVRDLVEAGLFTFVAGGTRIEDLDAAGRLGAAGVVVDALDVLRMETKENEGKVAAALESRGPKKKRAPAPSGDAPMRPAAPNPWE
jgi:phosphoribosylformimino-5-aminoimidazole carboxamide ribonucleotide (ProFAR) isomerase